jgi:hypothetical protein
MYVFNRNYKKYHIQISLTELEVTLKERIYLFIMTVLLMYCIAAEQCSLRFIYCCRVDALPGCYTSNSDRHKSLLHYRRECLATRDGDNWRKCFLHVENYLTLNELY